MIAIFVTYSQAFGEEIVDILDEFGQRGFTRWGETWGRGSENGTPHYGNHAWPETNQAILTIVDDDKADALLEALHQKDLAYPDLGLRAFTWRIDKHI